MKLGNAYKNSWFTVGTQVRTIITACYGIAVTKIRPCTWWVSSTCCDQKWCSKLGKWNSPTPYQKSRANCVLIASKDSDFYNCHDQHLHRTRFSQDSSKRNQNCGCTEVGVYHAEGERKKALKNYAHPKRERCNGPACKAPLPTCPHEVLLPGRPSSSPTTSPTPTPIRQTILCCSSISFILTYLFSISFRVLPYFWPLDTWIVF